MSCNKIKPHKTFEPAAKEGAKVAVRLLVEKQRKVITSMDELLRKIASQ